MPQSHGFLQSKKIRRKRLIYIPYGVIIGSHITQQSGITEISMIAKMIYTFPKIIISRIGLLIHVIIPQIRIGFGQGISCFPLGRFQVQTQTVQ